MPIYEKFIEEIQERKRTVQEFRRKQQTGSFTFSELHDIPVEGSRKGGPGWHHHDLVLALA